MEIIINKEILKNYMMKYWDIKMNFKEWNLEKQDKKYLIILFFILLLPTLKMLLYSVYGCISNPDIALYLLSGLKYAGLDYYNVVLSDELINTPIISFLSSLFFRLGYIDKNAIIIVTSVINFLGYFGLFLLLKNRFNSLLSFTGVIIYASLPLIIVNSTRGMIDLSSISISLWALFFAIIAFDKNPKYFLISFPLLVIGFFTKYTVGFTIPIIFLYYFMKRNIVDLFDCLISDKKLFKQRIKNYIKSKEFKYICISLIISVFLVLLISKFLLLDYGCSLTFFERSVNTFNGNDASNLMIDFNIDKSYYFDYFSDIIFESHILSFILTGVFFSFT